MVRARQSEYVLSPLLQERKRGLWIGSTMHEHDSLGSSITVPSYQVDLYCIQILTAPETASHSLLIHEHLALRSQQAKGDAQPIVSTEYPWPNNPKCSELLHIACGSSSDRLTTPRPIAETLRRLL